MGPTMHRSQSSASASPEGPKLRFEYYSPRPRHKNFDGLPFAGVYGATITLVLAVVVPRGTAALEHLLWIALPASLHVLVFLATHWSVELRCFVRYKREAHISKATHVKVAPRKATQATHRTLLVPVVRDGSEISITYQKKKFLFSETSDAFERLKFDVTSPLGTYLNSTGLTSEKVAEVTRRYGPNAYDIPLPTFGELFQEHAVAPFFVFQVFCVILWLMDEYWYYALMTLVMLIVLEAQLVQRRRSDLSELRGMRIPPRPLHVHRDGNWRIVPSDQLLPGDIVAISRKADVSFPCDTLLLQGNVLVNEAMLTGESVPQMKVAATPAPGSQELDAPLDIKGTHKQHIVSAGTTIMLHQNTSKAKTALKKIPTMGTSPAAVGYVLRTGFGTTQGKLCRTILFSAERVTVQSREALYFLMILLAFAICACIYVLYDGIVLQPLRTEEAPRSMFKLVLAVSHIITAVVPPEFPIMLSLAVNLSLVALVQKKIYCTEPFRVPLAGRVETCCFDKTGTLTSDTMEVDGVYGLEGFPPKKGSKPTEDGQVRVGPLDQGLPFLPTAVLAACSGLTIVEGEVVGDPLERAAFQAVGWLMPSPDLFTSRVGRGADRVQVLRRFPFASELQRMAVLVRHTGPAAGHLQQSAAAGAKAEFDRVLALVKGSCEALRPRLNKAPQDFDATYDRLTKSGLRVLCLAAKEMPGSHAKSDPEDLNREDLENDLDFCGLLVLRNSIKQHTSSTIKQLRRSYHRNIMITGDNPLTACQVAQNVGMTDRPFLTLELASHDSSNGDAADATSPLAWKSRNDACSKIKPFRLSQLRELTLENSLCVPGWSLVHLCEDELQELAPLVTVFARVSPQQKEQVLEALNRTSHTMMIGDGTNDVGALKHAHVGVSLLTSVAGSSFGDAAKPPGPNHMNAAELNGQAPIVRLGDASIASPFTFKGDSIKCGLHILRCGRATLSTVLMMYKIMGLNSVMSAFAMSVLTLDGVKLGDGQTAAESLFISSCFFMVSRSLPAKQLAKQHPTGSVFAWEVMMALALQLVIHLSVLLYGWQLANSFRPKDFKRNLEGDFEPNLTNTVVFQLIAAMHASSFLANYEGHPFMQPLRSNRALMGSLTFFVGIIFVTAAEVIPDLNSALSLVESPNSEFRGQLIALVTADLVLSVGLSKAVGSIAISIRGRAAEKRAQRLGLAT